MTIIERAKAPTPGFFRRLRLIGLILTAASGVLIGGGGTAGVFLEVVKHVASAGAVLMAVSQVTVDDKAVALKKNRNAK